MKVYEKLTDELLVMMYVHVILMWFSFASVGVSNFFFLFVMNFFLKLSCCKQYKQ